MRSHGDGLPVHAEAALEVLDRVLAQPPAAMTGELPEAVRALVRLRNRLIDTVRQPHTEPVQQEKLDRTNAILSVVTGGEYPMVGVRRQRIVAARDALARLVNDF